jgi:hypothetical protein
MTQYMPDFLITYRTRDNTVRAELIEIKPKKQSVIESKMNSKRPCYCSHQLQQMGGRSEMV